MRSQEKAAIRGSVQALQNIFGHASTDGILLLIEWHIAVALLDKPAVSVDELIREAEFKQVIMPASAPDRGWVLDNRSKGIALRAESYFEREATRLATVMPDSDSGRAIWRFYISDILTPEHHNGKARQCARQIDTKWNPRRERAMREVISRLFSEAKIEYSCNS